MHIMSTEVLIFTKIECPHCSQAKVVGEELSNSGESVKYISLDTAEGLAKSMKYRIRSVPTIMLVTDGSEQERWVYPMLPDKADITNCI